MERDSSGKEFHTLAPIKVVDFKPKFVVCSSFSSSCSEVLSPGFPIFLLPTTKAIFLNTNRSGNGGRWMLHIPIFPDFLFMSYVVLAGNAPAAR